MKKIAVWMLSAALCLAGGTATVHALAGAYFTGASHSLNNDLLGIDYKLTASQQNEVIDQLQYSFLSKVDLDESSKYLNDSTDRDIDLSGYSHDSSKYNKSMRNDQATAKSYLLRNNILERRGIIHPQGGTMPFVFKRCSDEFGKKWEEEFEEHREELQESLQKENVSKKEAVEMVNGLVEEGLEKLEEKIKDPDENSVYLGLKRYKKKFKKAVEGVNGKAKVTALTKDYVDEISEYCKGFKQNYDFDDDDFVTKTEMLMLLSKAAFGAQPSRVVTWNLPSVRNGDTYSQSTKDYWNNGRVVSSLDGYWDTGQFKGGANFASGDFYYYVSSNVYEIYLKDLLERGLIFEDEFGSGAEAEQFLEDYANFESEPPAWASSLGVCQAGLENSLGSAYYFQEGSVAQDMICHHSKFFKDETLTTMEIYQYVEDFLRVTEDDVTETEAEIITYKYGLNYLAPYSGSQLKTLRFLIAKGILNFENESEFCDLNAQMDYARLYQLVYRVANSKARYDFSQVQLTDSESYWMSNGYAESDVGITNADSSFVMNDPKATEIEDEDETAEANGLFSTVFAEKKTFEIVYKLTKELNWTYDGISVADMESGTNNPSTVVSVESGKIKYEGKTADVWELRLQIDAESARKATNEADKHLMSSSISGNTMPTVVKVNEKGKSEDPEEYTLISQRALKQNFSKISVIEDKVLVNIETGCQAILFPDLHYAMVGNTIIKTDGFIMEIAENEVYYNLKVIMAMIDNDFLKKTGMKVTVFHCKKEFKTYKVRVKNEYDSPYKATIATLKATKKMSVSGEEEDGLQRGENVHYYKVDDVTEGVNILVRKFSLQGKGDVWLVVDFNVVLPDTELLYGNDEFRQEMNEALDKIAAPDGKGLEAVSAEKIQELFYHRPTGCKALEVWWDSNYVASNALVNFMLGTKEVHYITSGYLTPSITVLGPGSKFENNEKVWLNELFNGISFTTYKEEVGTGESAETILGYVAGGSSWYNAFFSADDFVEGLEMKKSDKDVLAGMIAEYRTMNCISEVKIPKYGGHAFGSEFFLTNAGVLYRNPDMDFRVTADIVLGVVNSLQLTTRRPSETSLSEKTTIVTSNIGGFSPAEPKKSSQAGSEYKRSLLFQEKVDLAVSEDGSVSYWDDNSDGATKVSYYAFTPYSDQAKDLVHDDPKDPLYNGAYLALEQKRDGADTVDFGKLSLVVDRGMSQKDNRFSSLSDVFERWAVEYLGPYCIHARWDEGASKNSLKGIINGLKGYDYTTLAVLANFKGIPVSELMKKSESELENIAKDFRNETKNSVSDLAKEIEDFQKGEIKLPLNMWCRGIQSTVGVEGYYFVDSYGKDNALTTVRGKANTTIQMEKVAERFASAVNAYFVDSIPNSTSPDAKGEDIFLKKNDKYTVMALWDSAKGDVGKRALIGYSMNDIVGPGQSGYTQAAPSEKDYMNADIMELGKDGVSDRWCGDDTRHSPASDIAGGSAVQKGVGKKGVAIAIPTFYVPVSRYTVDYRDKQYYLVDGGTAASFCLNNMYMSGILKSVQENIIANSVETTTLSNLKAGNVVMIAGIRFFVDGKKDAVSGGKWMTSAILNILGTRDTLRKTAKNWKAQKNGKFTDEAKKIINSTVIYCDGRSYTLDQYVLQKKGKKGKYALIEVGARKRTPSTKKNGQIYANSKKKLYVYKKFSNGVKDRPISKNPNYKYVRVRYCFNDKLQVRPLNEERTEWTLTSTTVSGNYGDNFFFYDEELGHRDAEKANVDVTDSWFNPSAAFTQIKAQFMKVHTQLFAKDFKTWLLMIICAVAIYLCVITWIAYLTLHYGVMQQLFLAIDSSPVGKNGSGFDVVSFFTFKMFNLNDDPPLHRIVIIQVICIAVAAACVSLV